MRRATKRTAKPVHALNVAFFEDMTQPYAVCGESPKGDDDLLSVNPSEVTCEPCRRALTADVSP